jgi:hypothetical protein
LGYGGNARPDRHVAPAGPREGASEMCAYTSSPDMPASPGQPFRIARETRASKRTSTSRQVRDIAQKYSNPADRERVHRLPPNSDLLQRPRTTLALGVRIERVTVRKGHRVGALPAVGFGTCPRCWRHRSRPSGPQCSRSSRSSLLSSHIWRSGSSPRK